MIGPAISITEGFVLATESGELVVAYRVSSHVGYRAHVSTTIDLSQATVFTGGDYADLASEVLRLAGPTRQVPVKVERVVSLLPDAAFKLEPPPPASRLTGCRTCGRPTCRGTCV